MHAKIMIPLIAVSFALTACGGSSGGGKPKSSASSKAVSSNSSTVIASAAPGSSSVSMSSLVASSVSISPSIPGSSVASVVSVASSSAISTSVASTPSSQASSGGPVVIIADMTAGWAGNGAGNTGVVYTTDGVSFTPTADNQGAVFKVPKGALLEKAVIEMVVNVSSAYKASGANLQIFAQVENSGDAEWNCWASNNQIGDATDTTLTCKIVEDGKLNQTANDTKIGIQAKPGASALAGTVTIKSAKVTLAAPTSSSSYSAYSAGVTHLRDLASFPIGVAVSNTDSPSNNILTSVPEQTVVEQHFNQMTAGNIMKMKYLHPNNDTGTIADYTFTDADAFVTYAQSKNMTVHAHTLFWHADYQVPDFMKNWTGTSDDFLTMVDAHVTTLVDHFETFDNVVSWDVVNEALTDGNPSEFRTSPFYVKSGNSPVFIERAFTAARAADADVDLYYNDYNIENNDAKTDKLMEMVTDLQTKSIPITGVGFQMHVCLRWPSISQISAAMQKVVDKGLKVKITELDVAVNQPYCDSYPTNKINDFTQAIAFEQKKRYCDIVAAYMSIVPVAQRGGVTVWGTTDASTWLDSLYASEYGGEKISWPLLFDSQYGDKPALRGVADALEGKTCTNL
ncbi:MAG: endo-1,4-beta-xylanase [Pseudomonadota bacterium]